MVIHVIKAIHHRCDRRGNLEHMWAIPVDTDIEKLDWKRRVTQHRYTFLLFWEVFKERLGYSQAGGHSKWTQCG